MTADLRPVPASARPGGVSVLAGDDVRDAAVVHLEELLPQLPSLSWAGASSRPRYFQLRGIGELEQYQGAPNPSIGFLVDEIDFSGIGMIASLFDVEQVEVLRGPQGTRYGANALGGLIKVKTRDPAVAQSLEVEAGAGRGRPVDRRCRRRRRPRPDRRRHGRLARRAASRGQRRIPQQRASRARRHQRPRRDDRAAQVPSRRRFRLARRSRPAARGLRQRLRRVRRRQQLSHALRPAGPRCAALRRCLARRHLVAAGRPRPAFDHDLGRVRHRGELRRRLGQ